MDVTPAPVPVQRQRSQPTKEVLGADAADGLPKLKAYLQKKGLTDTSQLDAWTAVRKTGTTGVSSITYENPQGKVFYSKPKVAEFFGLKVNDGSVAPAPPQAGGDGDQGDDGEPSAKRPRDDGVPQQADVMTAAADGAPVAAQPPAQPVDLKAALATKQYLESTERPKVRSDDEAWIFLQIDRPVPLPAGAVAGKYLVSTTNRTRMLDTVEYIIDGSPRSHTKGGVTTTKDIVEVGALEAVMKYQLKVACANEDEEQVGPWSNQMLILSCDGTAAEFLKMEIANYSEKLSEAFEKFEEKIKTETAQPAQGTGITDLLENCQSALLSQTDRKLEREHLVKLQSEVGSFVELAKQLQARANQAVEEHDMSTQNSAKQVFINVGQLAPKYAKAQEVHKTSLADLCAKSCVLVGPALKDQNEQQMTLVKEAIATLNEWDGKVADAVDEATEGLVETHDKVYQKIGTSMADAMKNTLIHADKHLTGTKMGERVKLLEEQLPKKAIFGLAPPLV